MFMSYNVARMSGKFQSYLYLHTVTFHPDSSKYPMLGPVTNLNLSCKQWGEPFFQRANAIVFCEQSTCHYRYVCSHPEVDHKAQSFIQYCTGIRSLRKMDHEKKT